MFFLQSLNEFKDEVLFEIDGYTAQLCCSETSKRLAFQLRYKAYRHADAIPENNEKLFYDDYDHLPNTRVHLIWYEGHPIASVRSTIWSPEYNWIATEGVQYFWNDMHRQIGLDKKILESSRYLVAPEITGRRSLFVQLLMFRIQDLCSQVEDCDHIVTIVREKHAAFYKRMLAFEKIAGPKKYDWLKDNVVLLATTQEESRRIVTTKGMPSCEETEVSKYRNLTQQIKENNNEPKQSN